MDATSQSGLAGWHPGEINEGRDTRGGARRWAKVRREFAQERLASLTQAIEAQIIPRLVLAHREVDGPVPSPEPAIGPTHAEVVELTRILMTQGAAEVSVYVSMFQGRGMRLESMYLDLLAPAARLLGELWTADLCDFTTVTIGTGHLQQVIRELAGNCPTDIKCNCKVKKAVFAPTLGEQHTLGLVMVAEMFQRDGWDVCTSFPSSRQSLNTLVRKEWFDLIGLSVGSEARLDLVAKDIRSSRRASRNRAVVIMVGGPIFVANPALAARVGADATASDGRQALVKAGQLTIQPSADRSSA